MFLNFMVFYFTWESVSKIHETPGGSSLFVKFQIIIWKFPNIELHETRFHAFYSLTLLLSWRGFLNNITLILFLLYFIVLYIFYIKGYSVSRIYDKHLSMGITASQISE